MFLLDSYWDRWREFAGNRVHGPLRLLMLLCMLRPWTNGVASRDVGLLIAL